MSVSTPRQLIGKWDLYYHLPHDKNWDLSSYKTIMSKISTVEETIAINERLPENVIKYSMLFAMRAGITPMWEDPKNRNGGCFSYKVSNKNVYKVWKELTYVVVGNTVSKQMSYVNCVNGITISPKKNFCIIKIWMSDCSNQNPSVVTTDLKGLSPQGCLFKKHTPEY
jgi:hypothetical protein